MRFEILTLFPETFEGFLKSSLIGKAVASKRIEIHVHNIRDFAPHRRQVDDRPYGGGPGMVLMAEPVWRAFNWVKKNCLKHMAASKRAAYVLAAKGKPFQQVTAKRLACKKALVLLAGHYEGIDERILPFFDGEISIGPYVTMGGEVPSMILIEAIARLIPGVLGNPESLIDESFSISSRSPAHTLSPSRVPLEWPQYTRPAVWRGKKVPSVLLSGNHAQIQAWRQKHAKPLGS